MHPSLNFSKLEVVREPSGPDAVIRIPIEGEAELAMKAGVYLPAPPVSVAGTEIKKPAVTGTRSSWDGTYEFCSFQITVRDYAALDSGAFVAWATGAWSDAVERARREQVDLGALQDALRRAAAQ